MRISTLSKYVIGSTDMSSLQQNLQKLQMQLDTQRRIVTPSDDPVAAGQVLTLNQALDRNTQFISNNKTAESALSITETAVGHSVDLLSTVKQLAVQAGNGGLSPQQLKMIQTQVGSSLQQLVGYANSTDGNNQYMFGGNKSDNPPFTLNAATNAVTYNGDNGVRNLGISTSRQISISEDGSKAFGDATSQTAVFDTMQQFYNLLSTPPNTPAYTATLNTVLSGLDKGIQNLSQVQADIGSRRKENEDTQNVQEDFNVQYNSSISGLQDLDLYSAISNFTLTQTSLQYAQQTYAKVSNLSLFNYIQ